MIQPRMIPFLLTASAVYAAMHALVAWRLLSISWLPGWARTALGALLVVNWLMGPSTFIVRAWAEQPWASAFVWVGYSGMGVVAMLFGFVLMRELVWLAVQLGHALTAGPMDPSRRQLLGDALSAATGGLGGLLSAVGIAQALRPARVVRVDVPIADLHQDLVGMTIAQVSDIHVGATIRAERVRGIVESVNALGADLIAITGDLVDGSVSGIGEHVAPLAELSAPLGAWFCTGNHEYYSNAEPWCEFIEGLGIPVLTNAHRVVERGSARVVVAGVPDISGYRILPSHASDPAAALAGAPAADLKLLLAHQPRSAFKAAAAGFDLQLSGHTHGGQFFPYTILIKLAQPFSAGLHLCEDMWIYTNSGTTWWGPPVRLGAPQEITLLTLKRA